VIRASLLLVLVAISGCGDTIPTFRCSSDPQCSFKGKAGSCVDKGADGRGVCALSDGTCASGLRYHESAGPGAGLCLGEVDLAVPPSPSDMAAVDFATTMVDDLANADLVPPPDLTVVRRWVSKSPPGGSYVGGSSSTNMFLVGTTIYRSTDQMSWPATSSISPAPTALQGLWVGSPSNAYVANGSTGGTVAYQSTGGNAWAGVTGPMNLVINSVWGTSDGNAVFATGTALAGGGVIIKRTNNNGNFVDTGTSARQRAVAIFGAPTGSYIFVAANSAAGGAVLKATSVTGAFTEAYTNSREIYGVWCTSDGMDVYAVGGGGLVAHSTDGGMTWLAESGTPNADLFGVWGVSASDVWAVGNNGVIVHRQPNGTWGSVASPTSGQLTSVWASSATDVWAAGSNALLHYE